MALIGDLEDVAIGAVGVLLLVLVVALILAIRKIKLPGLPDFSSLLDKLLNALRLGGGGSDVLPDSDGGNQEGGYDISTGIGVGQ